MATALNDFYCTSDNAGAAVATSSGSAITLLPAPRAGHRWNTLVIRITGSYDALVSWDGGTVWVPWPSQGTLALDGLDISQAVQLKRIDSNNITGIYAFATFNAARR